MIEKQINENKKKYEKLLDDIEIYKNYLFNRKETLKNTNINDKNENIDFTVNIKEENIQLKKENEELIVKINELKKQYEVLLNNIKEKKKEKKKPKLHSSLDNLQIDFEDFNNNNYEKKKLRNNSIGYKELKEPIQLYNTPTLIGLNNIGATCFMNSTLQCLSQTESLTNYFLKEKNANKIFNNNIAKLNINELQLSPVYYELIQNLWAKNKMSSFSPNHFMNTIEKMNPLFKLGQAGDSKDFIIFILEQIHKELKEPIKGLNNNINIIQTLNQYDKINAFNFFFNEFKKECSIISDIFFGFTETTNVCLNCQNIYNSQGMQNPICYNYQIFNCLIFPLEEVKNMKNNQNQYYQNNCVTLYDCFLYNQKSELFTGENRNYCNVCKQLFDSMYTSKIYICPTILVLILNRGKGNIYDVNLDFSETIDITQFVLQKDKDQITYNLYAVITHIGQSGPSAHFVASCKSPIDKLWYRYNDAFVNPINNFQKDVINFGTPYILFYHKN